MIKDPYMLLSYINTKLRDIYKSLDDLCDDLDYDKEEVINILVTIGYQYNLNKNTFTNVEN